MRVLHGVISILTEDVVVFNEQITKLQVKRKVRDNEQHNYVFASKH